MVLAAEEAIASDPLVSAKGSGLWRYILIRFFLIFPTVIILVTVVFFLTRITGDPITAALGGPSETGVDSAAPSTISTIRRSAGGSRRR